MINREELIAVLKAVERKLRDSETIQVQSASGGAPPRRANVRLLRLALEAGEKFSDEVSRAG